MACCYRDTRQKSLADWKAAKDQEELEAAEWRAEQQELQRQVSSLLQASALSSKLRLLLLVVYVSHGPSSNRDKAFVSLPECCDTCSMHVKTCVTRSTVVMALCIKTCTQHGQQCCERWQVHGKTVMMEFQALCASFVV